MSVTPTPLTASLAGIFSGLTWPWIWSWFGGPGASGTVELIAATLVLVALPAHAFVLGFGHRGGAAPGGADAGLLVRVLAWLASAAVTAVVVSFVRGSP